MGRAILIEVRLNDTVRDWERTQAPGWKIAKNHHGCGAHGFSPIRITCDTVDFRGNRVKINSYTFVCYLGFSTAE